MVPPMHSHSMEPHKTYATGISVSFDASGYPETVFTGKLSSFGKQILSNLINCDAKNVNDSEFRPKVLPSQSYEKDFAYAHTLKLCVENIALIAHDNKKADLIEWCEQNKDILTQHFLCGTGTTARMITDKTGLPVKGYNSGPLGGDQQIGAKIVEGRIDFVVFFSDPLTAQPHDPDVKALLRIAQVYDIPIANNRASADFMIHSEFMNEEYEHEVINFKKNIKERSETL